LQGVFLGGLSPPKKAVSEVSPLGALFGFPPLTKRYASLRESVAAKAVAVASQLELKNNAARKQAEAAVQVPPCSACRRLGNW
jgi:hypothetical protein